jgi:hypothetical protein
MSYNHNLSSRTEMSKQNKTLITIINHIKNNVCFVYVGDSPKFNLFLIAFDALIHPN